MNTEQEYAKYTPEDFDVWKLLYERQMQALKGAAVAEYFAGIKRVNFVADAIPNFDDTNSLLANYTGWQLVVVPGLIPDMDFFKLLAQKQFPASTWLRQKSELDYLEEPDMFHDVFGHVPLLTNENVVEYLQHLSIIALRYAQHPLAIELMSRIYWFTVEFGLIRENGALHIYGAGILSSKGETAYSLLDSIPERHPFDVEKILNTPFHKDVYQQEYFVLDSFAQLAACIPELDRLMEQKCS